MNDSYKFFANKDCKDYPCHEGIEEMNCLFCYCPLYHMDSCPGTPSYTEKDGRTIKICTSCIFPHKAENYDEVIGTLRKEIQK